MVSDLVLYTLIGAILFYMFYRWATAHERYFSQRSMKHFRPTFLFRNTIGLFLKLYTPTDFLDSIYYRFPKEKYVPFIITFVPLCSDFLFLVAMVKDETTIVATTTE